MNMTLSCVSSLMLFWVRVPKWIFPHLHIQSFLWNVLSESGRLPAKGSNSINSPASRMWCCGVPARGFHLWKPSRPCVLYAGPSLFCSQPWAMCRCVFTLHWATWNWTWQVHVMNLAWKLFPNTQYKVCARWCHGLQNQWRQPPNSKPVGLFDQWLTKMLWLCSSKTKWCQHHPAPTQIPPQIPDCRPCHLAPQHPQETPQLISLDRWKYCLAGAEASTRSMTRKDLHDFASRCPPHPSHGVVWPCQNGMTWVKALPLCHFCKWLTEKQKSNEPSSRREEVFRNHVFITWSLSAPPLPQDPTTGQSTFRMPKYPFHFLQVLSKALHPLNLDCLALEGPSKHWTSDPSPLFHILLRWKLVTLGFFGIFARF